jgi:hypothetical protein
MLKPSEDSTCWWAARRRRYNVFVIFIGIGCFLIYQALVTCTSIEVTIFTIALQGIAAGLYVLVANVAYCAAPLVQKCVQPSVPERFQIVAFRLGIAITVLPFVAVPVLVLLRIRTSHGN